MVYSKHILHGEERIQNDLLCIAQTEFIPIHKTYIDLMQEEFSSARDAYKSDKPGGALMSVRANECVSSPQPSFWWDLQI